MDLNSDGITYFDEEPPTPSPSSAFPRHMAVYDRSIPLQNHNDKKRVDIYVPTVYGGNNNNNDNEHNTDTDTNNSKYHIAICEL